MNTLNVFPPVSNCPSVPMWLSHELQSCSFQKSFIWETVGVGQRQKVVGIKILKRPSLVSGAGKQSPQNKWEVNTQPQEAIYCSRGQLGPSRCSGLGPLWSCLTSVWQSADPGWGNNGQFHLLSNLKQSIPTGGPLKSFIIPPLSSAPPPPSASH